MNDNLVGSPMNLAPDDQKYLHVTDTLLELFNGPAVKASVWVAFILERNPEGPPALVCSVVEMLHGKLIRFEAASAAN